MTAVDMTCKWCGEPIVVCPRHHYGSGGIVHVIGATGTGYRHVDGPDGGRGHEAYPGDDITIGEPKGKS